MRRTVILLLALLLAFTMFACGAPAAHNTPAPSQTPEAAQAEESHAETTQSPEQPSGAAETVTDLMDNTETLALPAATVVSLSPSTTEILYALDMQDKILAVDAFSNYPETAQQLPQVGDFSGPNIEAIVALQPDVVLAGNGLQQDAVDKLHELGIPVLCTEARAFDEVYGSMRLIGRVVGADAEAEALCQSIEDTRAQIEARAKEFKHHAKAYYVISYGEMGNWTSGPGSFMNELMEIAGFECVTKDAAAPWIEYSLEDLVSAQPDCLLVSSDIDSSDLLLQPGYDKLTAPAMSSVQGVREVDADVMSRPGPRLIDAMAQLYDIAKDWKDRS